MCIHSHGWHIVNTDAITLAVFLPTPGNCCNCSQHQQVLHHESHSLIFSPYQQDVSLCCLDNWYFYQRKYFFPWAYCKLNRIRKASKKPGCLIYSLSVHWADRITATNIHKDLQQLCFSHRAFRLKIIQHFSNRSFFSFMQRYWQIAFTMQEKLFTQKVQNLI